jgi:Uma2 family endonuclease
MSPTTSTTNPPVPGFLANATFHLSRLTVDQYHRMIQSGILPEGEPIELIEGYLVQKMSWGTPHDEALDSLDEFLLPLVPAGWYARSQRAISLADSEPEPDYVVVRGPRARNRGHHPYAADVGLVIEISDSSLKYDRFDKARVYARAAIPAYWVVNVVDKVVEVFTRPSGATGAPGYAQHDEYPVGTAVPVVLDGTQVGTVAVADVMA